MTQDPASASELGTLRELSVEEMKKIWPREAQDLSPWIRDNIHQLNDALGLQIEIEEAEGSVEGFRLDLAGTDGLTQKPVVIEIQFGQGDHGHLGKLITYSANREAGIMIWVANAFQTAHRDAVEWLNAITDLDLSFYGLLLQVFQVDDSRPAAKFTPVAGPPVGKRPRISSPSPLQQSYSKFWEKFLHYMHEVRPGFLRAKKPQPQRWFSTGAGRSGFSIDAGFAGTSKFRVALYIDVGNKEKNTRALDGLTESKAEVEEALSQALLWQALPEHRACRICLEKDGSILEPPDRLNELIAWGAEWMVKLKSVFAPRLRTLDF